MEFKTKIIARYAETDKMGIIHHSVYPIWFEAARTEFIKTLGYSYSQIEEMGLMLPLLELNCKYKSPAFYEDEITIFVKIGNTTNVTIEFLYFAYNKDNKLLNEGMTCHAWTNKSLKPVALKKACPDIYNILQEYKIGE